MVIIDPMHNLLLGSAKNALKTWIETKKLTSKDFEKIQHTVDSMKVPAGIGRIPYKIKSGFSGFTADQWKNWTCFYSIVALKGILPENDFKCWQKFSMACQILCTRSITLNDLNKAHSLLLGFCKSFANLYGNEFCTPNMHLHIHLKSCILDHGPVYSFWLFSFERYNGILGSVKTNNRLVSVQVMRKFLQNSFLHGSPWPEDFHHFEDILQSDSQRKDIGTLKNYNISAEVELKESAFSRELSVVDYTSADYQLPLGPVKEDILVESEFLDLKTMFQELYKDCKVTILSLCERHKRIKQGQTVLRGSVDNGSVIVACWYEDGAISSIGMDRVGNIDDIITVEAAICRYGKKKKVVHHLAYVTWFKLHPEKDHYGKPVTVWQVATEPPGPASYMPLQRIKSVCVNTTQVVDFGRLNENVLVVAPLVFC